jgi:hypothetical protein
VLASDYADAPTGDAGALGEQLAKRCVRQTIYRRSGDARAEHAVAFLQDRVATRTRLQADQEIYVWHRTKYA